MINLMYLQETLINMQCAVQVNKTHVVVAFLLHIFIVKIKVNHKNLRTEKSSKRTEAL